MQLRRICTPFINFVDGLIANRRHGEKTSDYTYGRLAKRGIVSCVLMVLPYLIGLALVSVANAARVTYDWTVTKVPNINPDGLQPRTVLGINGQWPPPPININSSDQFNINFKNGLGDGTPSTLHSHGMFFNRTNFFDGAGMITQCPIPDGQGMVYEVLNSPRSPPERFNTQWGTYWTHSHYKGQYVDGFRMPSVIHNVDDQGNNREAHQYDDDFTISLGDWYHEWSGVLNETEFMTVSNPSGAEPIPKSHLMYFQHTPWNGQASNLPGFNENATLHFEPGKTYRLRLVNMASLAMFYFWIEGHQMEIIEVDGVDTQAFPVDHVSISVAQRVSVLVRAREDADPKNWRINLVADGDMYDNILDDLQMNVTSTISYGDGLPYGDDGRATLDELDIFDETQLVPVVPIPMYELTDPSQSHRLDIYFTTFLNGINYATFNNNTFVAPLVPSIMTMASEGEKALDPLYFGPNAHAITSRHLEVVEFVLYNWDSGYHPFHLHGTSFQVVWRQEDLTSDDPADKPEFNPNQTNPIRRDTVMVPPAGRVAIRFIADNPGAWFFHCHIDWHLASGLALVMIQGPEVFQQMYGDMPSTLYEQCRAQNMNTTGNAGGIPNSTTYFGLLPAEPELPKIGWTPVMIGTFVACILAALMGISALCIYGMQPSPEDDDEVEDYEDHHVE